MGSLIKPLSAMTVATTQDGHAPTGGSGVRTQVANGATMNLEDWWNNTGKNLYTELVNTGNITTAAPVNQEYTPGVTLSGVMNRANQIMGNTASPETQQAAVSAVNNSSFNFDAPTFDPNAGKQEARDKMYSDYMATLANSGKRRINMRKANENFNKQFEQEWLNGEAGRRNQFNQQQRDKKMNALKQSFFDAANNFSINLQDDVTAAREAEGQVFDAKTGQWSKPAQPVQTTPGKSNDYWNSVAQQYGFNDMNAVAAWQRENGLEDDGKFGQNSLNKWNELQAATQPKQKSIGRDIVDDMPIVGSIVTGKDFFQNPSKETAKSFGKRVLWDAASFTPGIGTIIAGSRAIKGLWDGAKGFWNKLPENKQGGTLIKKHQQGGNMEQDIQSQVKQLVQAVAAGDQQAAEQVKQIMQAAEQGDQQALQIAQMIQAEIESMKTSAKLGAKLNYIKQLKGDCLEGEELVYFKKGGMICSKCEKKHEQVVAAKGKKLNAVDEFKKTRKSCKK